TKGNTRAFIDSLTEVLKDELTQTTGKVQLRGIGTFEVVTYRKTGRPGQLKRGTETPTTVEPANQNVIRVKFTPSIGIKRALRQKQQNTRWPT
ncbi:MAG: HU family DNA-binding protein, partial [Chloroflexota bacterium]